MTRSDWYVVGALDDIPRRSARTVQIAGREIAVFRTADNHVFALENHCPHRGGPLVDGIVHGRRVACPLHDWVLDLETGAATGADHGCAETFPVEIVDGRIRLAVAGATAAAE